LDSSHQQPLIYEFGGFRLDARRRLLSSHDGTPLAITGKVFDTLLYFVERPGQLLDKRSLLQALWPGVVVEEGNLTQTIHTLRRILGERPGEHRFIVTEPGRGYRFVASVSMETPAEPRPVEAVKLDEPVLAASPWRRRFVAGVLSLAVLCAALFLIFGMPTERPQSSAEAVAPSIAVLPFVDMSPEGNQEYFADGLSEEILNLLAHSASLRVIARTSSFAFRNHEDSVAAIAKKLGVTHVLEGSVRKSGEHVRITAQLVDGITSEHVWSETYDRELKDVFGVQSDIAAAVAGSLRITLAGEDLPERRETVSEEAFERYLAGRHFLNRRGAGDVAKAEDNLKQALQIDPGYARAWAALAGTYRVKLAGANPTPEVTLREWREAVDQALSLGPNLAESHVRAAQYFWDLGDPGNADLHCKRAIVLNPSDAMVLSVSASKAVVGGRLDEAISLQRRAVAIDPLSAVNHFNLGIYLTAVGDLADAKVELEKGSELSPTQIGVNTDIARVLILEHRFDDALAAAEKLPEGRLRDHSLALVHQARRDTDADIALARLIEEAQQPDATIPDKLAVAEVLALRGDRNETFRWLDLAMQQARRESGRIQELDLTWEITLSPFLDDLHDDPRWSSVLADVM
jgi:TolB-like protein/DNA-binding winged helix-turn-helix (wHTH) protein/Tfp pilus assembly protein PilF